MQMETLRGVRKNWFIIAAAIAFTLLEFTPARAEFPEQPLRLILPYGPGGVSDVMARIVADKLGEKLGQSVVVENMPGPGGINAARAVVRSPANGYTLGFLSNGTAVSVDLFEHLPFDPVKQFAMVSEIGTFDLLIAVSAESKYKSLQDLVEAAKISPGTLNLGTVAVGSTQNLGAELFRSATARQMVIVPYKNSPDIIVGLLRGDVDAMFDFPPALEGQVRDGKLRILASSGLKRSPFLPNVPTAAESGVTGYDVTSWIGMFAPADTPKNVIDKLHDAIAEIVNLPEVRAKFAKVGIVAQASTPQELMDRLTADIAKWDSVIKRAGIPKK